jgi:hypothetical protein
MLPWEGCASARAMPWPCEVVNRACYFYSVAVACEGIFTKTGPAPRRIARPDGAIVFFTFWDGMGLFLLLS